MYPRLCIVVACLMVGAGASQAQQLTAGPAIEEQCRAAASPDGIAKLEKRQQQLERDIAKLVQKVGDTDTPKAGDTQSAQRKALRSDQESLLKIVLQLECARARLEQQSVEKVPTRAPMKRQNQIVEVTTYYATNRNQTDKTEPAKVYGSAYQASLRYGRAVVSIPLTHTTGNIELPRLWKLERQPDPTKHFVLKSVSPMDQDSVRREMLDKLDASGRRAVLVFVHGYNLSFEAAAMRTAQLAHDLGFAGVPFFYSWPSANQLLSYWQDEETAQLSEGVFGTVLDDLARLPSTDVYIVAHSMGNRIVSQALKSRMDAGKDTKNVRELMLAAPDINAELFRTVLAPKLAAMQGTRTTIYASSSDLALKASKVVHGFRRLGETLGGVFTYQGIETIDASTVNQQTRAYGHFYLMDNALVLKDVRTIIEQKFSAKQRGLNAIGQTPNVFWRFN